MKNLSKYFLMGTVALSGMTAFTACSSENEPSAEVNPTFNGSTVKTQFALNLPYAATGTRQGADVAQQDGKFRGIQDMRLLPFTGAAAAGQTSASLITLGYNSDAFQSDGSDASQGRYIYRDVEIPVGTKNFVFYGKATGAYSSVDNKFTNGNLVEEGLDGTVALDGVKFNLEAINSGLNLKNAATADDTKSYKKVLKALQTVTNTKVTSADKTIEWTNVDVPSSGATDYAKLNHAKKLWEAFKTLTAGSAASVREALNRLEESVGVDALADGATAKADGDDLLKTLKANIKTAKELLDKNEETGKNTFPADIYLPDGAVQVQCGADNTWSFKSPEVQVGDASINYAKIAYPAALYYTVNTPVKANDKASTGLADDMWPGRTEWTGGTATWGEGWTNEVVNSTRTIALEKAIQYGVANLKTTVKLKAKNLDDNAKAKGGQVKDQNINADSKLKLTGVLVGGQPEYVGWDFKAPAATSFDYTVYDNKIASNAALTTTASDPNYTLVLDNNKDGEQENVVYVVLEFENNTGVDFYGKEGMVPKGGKFYLVGKLDMNTVSDTNKNGCNHIFVQDRTTVANFTIKDLKDAYNNIPDLRSTSVSVGLAVNLTWEDGILFDNVEI